MTSWLTQYPPDVQLRFNGAVHACLVCLADPLPDTARLALENFIVDSIPLEDICSIANGPGNPARLRASCFTMLTQIHAWNLDSKRRRVLIDHGMQGTRDGEPIIRREALALLGQINSDCIMARQTEIPDIIEVALKMRLDQADDVAEQANELLEGWSIERLAIEEEDARVRAMEEIAGDL